MNQELIIERGLIMELGLIIELGLIMEQAPVGGGGVHVLVYMWLVYMPVMHMSPGTPRTSSRTHRSWLEQDARPSPHALRVR